MALSWIFSGKKKEEKPVTVEAVEVGSFEDFTLIQSNSSRMGLYPQVPPSPYPYTPLSYTVVPSHRDERPVGNSFARTTSVQNQLEGVPFVLSPVLDKDSSPKVLEGLEDLRRAIFQITADVNDSVFDYDFKQERSILQEAASVYNHNN